MPEQCNAVVSPIVSPIVPVSAQCFANDDPIARDAKEFWCCKQGRWCAGRPEARFIPTFGNHCWCWRIRQRTISGGPEPVLPERTHVGVSK